MRFALALVTLVVAAALVLAGVAQRTVLKPADHITAAASVPAGVRYAVVPAAVLRAHPGQQRLRLSGDGTAFAAYGRTADVRAWLSGQRYAELRVDDGGRMLAPVIRTAPVVAGLTGGEPDPDGSDLWLDQRRAKGSIDWSVSTPSSVSVLVAADGSAAAPSDVSVTWPNRNATPWAIPMILAGGALAVLGLLLYVWALVHVRRRRGPRRKSPPKVQRKPQPPRYRPQKAPQAAPGRGRRSVKQGALRIALPATVAGAVLGGGLGTPAAMAAGSPAAAVTEQQAVRIVDDAVDVAHRSDADLDSKLLATRFAGPALQLRKAAYTIHRKSKKIALPQALPSTDPVVQPVLPEATASWPRTLFAVVTDRAKSSTPPVALTLVQDDPRSRYTVRYATALQPKAQLPVLPAATTGANRLGADTAVLRVPPAELVKDYGLLLRKPDTAAAKIFDTTQDELVAGVGAAVKKKAVRRLGSTAGITFADAPVDPSTVVAMSTADSGALVAVNLDEQWTVKPKRAGVTVKPSSGGTKILSKTASTTKGFVVTYGYQLLFSVPSAGSAKPVVLLGYAQGLVSAKEL